MSPAVAEYTPPMPRQLRFVPGERQPSTGLPLATAVQFPLEPIAVNDTSPTAAELDGIIEQLLRQYGAGPDQLRGVTFDVMPPSLGVPEAGRGAPTPFKVTVRRVGHAGYIARPSVGLAYGDGETPGAAFRDCMDDFLYRQRLLYAERDRLGPGMEEELREMERLHGGAR